MRRLVISQSDQSEDHKTLQALYDYDAINAKTSQFYIDLEKYLRKSEISYKLRQHYKEPEVKSKRRSHYKEVAEIIPLGIDGKNIHMI